MKNYKKSSSLKDLEKLFLEAKKLKYPNNPYPVGDKFRDDTANGLTRAIIAYIRLKGGQSERISNTGRPIIQTKSFTDVIWTRRSKKSPSAGANWFFVTFGDGYPR